MYILNLVGTVHIVFLCLSFCLLQQTVDETNKRICKITGSLSLSWW